MDVIHTSLLSVTLRTNLPSQCRYFMQYLVCVPNLIKKNQAKKKKKNQSISHYLSIKSIPITLFNCRGKKKINYTKITLSRKWKQKGKQWLLSRRFYLNDKKSNKFRIILNYLLGNWTKKKKKKRKKVAYRLGIGFVQLNGSLNELVPRSYVNHCCAAEKSREQLIQVNLYMNRYMRIEERMPFFVLFR